MRLSGLSLAVLLTASILFAQHPSGGGSSSSSSSSSSSGGGSHSSSSGGSGYSGGSSSGGHSSSGGSSHSAGSSHSSGSGHSSGGTGASSSSHVSGVSSTGTALHSKAEHGTTLVSPSHNGIESSSSKMTHPMREPKSGISERVVVPQKHGFFSFLRHPFRKPRPEKVVEAKPALYLPRPICPKGRCAPPCPVGQVRGGGACTSPVIPVCATGLVGNTHACGSQRYHCALGQVWNGTSCVYDTQFLDRCIGLRMALERQAQRVQNAEAARQRACANGPRPECSDASASWQSEENMRQNLLRRYQQCRIGTVPMYSSQYGSWRSDSTRWFDSLSFNADF